MTKIEVKNRFLVKFLDWMESKSTVVQSGVVTALIVAALVIAGLFLTLVYLVAGLIGLFSVIAILILWIIIFLNML